jgi:Icc-related predicted phosphoesterase
MVKILVLGDLHGFKDLKKVPELSKAEAILLTGDLGSSDLMRKMAFENIEREKKGLLKKEYSLIEKKRAFMESYESSLSLVKKLSKFAPVFVIFGNVESSNYETKKMSKEIGVKLPFLNNDLRKMKNVRLINNRIARINGLRIGGLGYFIDTSWVMEFKPLDYKSELSDAKIETEKTKRILMWFGKDLDILLCHQPPYGILDKVGFPGAPKHWIGKHAGSKAILNYIKKKNPKYVFCGHIHEGKGKKKLGKTEIYNVGSSGDYVFLDIN